MKNEEKLNAVLNNNAGYDGLFFYAVKSTGIFCRPSCKSKQPKKKNILFFDSASMAQKAGFRPCKRCRPDLQVYRPAQAVAEKTKKLADNCFREKKLLDAGLKKTGFSRRRIEEIFIEQYGVSLFGYINLLRLNETKRLLAETNNGIADIAYTAGFGSLSAFYRFFKQGAGCAPAVYRKKMKKETGRNIKK